MKFLHRSKDKRKGIIRSFLILLMAFGFAFSQYGVALAAEAKDAENENRRRDGAWFFPQNCNAAPEAAPGQGAPNGITFPNLDVTAMANAIEKYIEEEFPDSPFKGTGAAMVVTGHQTNVSPFLLVALAAKESSMGTNGDLINKANNGFGRTASDRQPHIVGTDGRLYYNWTSVKASVDITDPSHAQDPAKSGDMGSYLRAIAAYEPAFNANSLEMLLNEYAPPSENDTGGYISFAQGIIDKLAKYAQGDQPEPNDPNTAQDPGSTSTSICACDPTAGAPVIALDAGHVKAGNPKTETVKGITATESNQEPETTDMWEVTEQVKKDLEEAGYRVVLTKRKIDENISLFERARRANAANADLAISIHYDAGRSWNNFAWVTPQSLTAIDEEEGENSTKKIRARRYTDNKTVYFDQKKNAQDLANKSAEYAQKMIEARAAAEKRPVQMHDLIFPKSRGLASSGNISIVQLFADVPWIYNEVGAQGGFGNGRKDMYAEGIVNGVKAAFPLNNAQVGDTAEGAPSATNPGCAGSPGANGDAIAMAMYYAWETYRPPNYFRMKPSYRGAVDTALEQGRYVGGWPRAGIDCGGFVSLVMQDSGADPNYNFGGKGRGGNTTSQLTYLLENPDKYERVDTTSTKDLRPGAIAFNSTIPTATTHTYMYIGKQPGFQTPIASASWSGQSNLNWRTPMAGHDSNGVVWFMLK